MRSQTKFSFLLEIKTEMENSITQESSIVNLESLIPTSRPPEEPTELLNNQKLILLLKAFSCLAGKDYFLVSCIATMSILCILRDSLSALRLLGRPRPLEFQQKQLIIGTIGRLIVNR